MTLELPLLALFEQLRLLDLPLGVAEYRALLQGLAAGFGLPDRAALLRLCQMLWTSSPEEAALLRWHFDRLLMPAAPAASAPQVGPLASAPLVTPSQPSTSTVAPAATTVRSNHGGTPELTVAPLAIAPILDEIREIKVALSAVLDQRRTGLRQILRSEYLPVTKRQMKQSWRHLRQRVREGPKVELDERATILRCAKDGLLCEPAMTARRVNRARVVFLLDWDGSMVPFHDLVRRLVETAMQGGQLCQGQTYYFHNCPVEQVYGRPSWDEDVSVPKLLRGLTDRTALIIVSDGGAARGTLNLQRLAQTRVFLRALRQAARRVAWLNPMPRDRWRETTAARIARHVPMFEFSRQGLDETIDVLRGRTTRRSLR